MLRLSNFIGKNRFKRRAVCMSIIDLHQAGLSSFSLIKGIMFTS